MIGQSISHYKILEKLGEGGMGVVYKAEDTKLDRLVALKFLPSHLSASEQDKARFIQEAKAASSLNHPNVCTIHDIQEHDQQMFIVMEFVEGQTLREKKGSISLKQAVDIGVQIADGLAAAHEKSIVHRDIKPENIMIRKDGIAQIMDFGLAKLRGVSRLTKEGSTVGTAGYMSPEQVQGQDADHRSDIFSLGVLLYELFTGQLPFKGVHETAIMYEIVNVDPSPMSSIKPEIDPNLDAIVLECLEKDPNERMQSVKQVSIDLKRFKRESSRQHVTRAMPAQQFKRPFAEAVESGEKARSWRNFFWPGLSGVLTLAVIFLAWLAMGGGTAAKYPVMRFPINLPLTAPLIVGAATVAISPDGKHIAYLASASGNSQLFLRPIDQFTAQPIPGTDGANDPFFSPDGQWIAFWANGKVKKVSIFGGAPQEICDAQGFMRGGWWAADNSIWFGHINSPIYRVSASGGTPEEATVLDSVGREISHRFPQPLPDGKTVIFTIKHDNIATFDEAVIAAENTSTHERKVLIQGGSYARYVPTGHLIYARGTSIYAAPFDAEEVEVTGPPLPVVEGGMLNQLSGTANFDVSGTGTLVYVPLGPISQDNTTIAWMDRQGNIQPLLDTPRPYDEASLSPDGQKLAMTIRAANDDIWVYHIARRTLTRLTFGGGNSARPGWTPDGKRVAYISERKRSLSLFWKQWDGSGVEERLGDEARVQPSATPSFTRDGRIMAYNKFGDIWIMPVDGDRKSRPFIQSPAFENGASFSPDGRWMSYISNESSRNELYVVPFPNRDGKWQISTNGASNGGWSRKGSELLYSDGAGLMKVDVRPGPSFDFSPPQKVCALPSSLFAIFDVTPDGRRFLVGLTRAQELSATQVNVVVGWFEELEQKFAGAGK